MKLSVIIPAYNEEKTIAQVITAVQAVDLPAGLSKEIILVDDGSRDASARVVEPFVRSGAIRLFLQSPNQGKTAAIRRGIQEATGDFILIQDADLEYHPSQYPALVQPILDGRGDVVYGSRFKGAIRNMESVNRWANVLSNLTFNVLFGTRLTDINTCFKLFRAADIRSISIDSHAFAFETEVTAKLVKKGLKIIEVPIDYEARSVEQGKKINWSTALGMYGAIIKHRFS
jgi:glycosyltransferase involved in cell wall biosynthesis